MPYAAALLTIVFALTGARLHALEAVEVTVQEIGAGLWMLTGRGGNVAAFSGSDGTVLVDDQYPEQFDPIRNALSTLGIPLPEFVINTHWHSDHTGSNAAMSALGAAIIAHDKVRERLASDQVIEFFDTEHPAAPTAALPVITFPEELRLHRNGEIIRVFHLPHAHTDGDAVVRFEHANVVHTGDIFFNGRYPFIDTSAGGSVSGMIAAVEAILVQTDDDTRIIPGHGPLATRKDLEHYLLMLRTIHNSIATLMVAGNDLQACIAARPTAHFDPLWGQGFLAPDQFVRLVFDSITRETLDPVRSRSTQSR